MKNLSRFLFLFFISFPFPFTAAAQPAREQIERFDVSASVNVDSSVDITERITVRAAGSKIRRGIFRVLPYKGVSDYEIISVLRDGQQEPYRINKSSAGKTVYIGDASVSLFPGRYVYELSYKVKGAVRFQKQFDEFYWNVTGNEWQFPILSASLRLTLPHGAKIVRDGISLYTGYAGQSGPASARAQGDSFFFTTRPLAAGEGLTVSAAWNKGAVREPSLLRRILDGPWRAMLWFFPFWLLLLGYYVAVWRRVGKDPAARVIRRFEPPEDLSPAQVHYLCSMGIDSLTYSVIMMSLLQKGYIRVKKDACGDFTLIRQDSPKDTALSAEETAYLEKLFQGKSVLPVDNRYAETFQSAASAARKQLTSWAGGRFFSWNSVYNLPTLLFVVFIVANRINGNPAVTIDGFLLGVGLFIPCCVVTALIGKFFPRVAAVFFFLGIGYVTLSVLGQLWGTMFLAVLIPGVVFWWLVRAYTPLGRKKMDEIEGFLEYLTVAETNRVFASDPTDAARIYCNYLPYAVALNVQNKWWNALAAALGTAAAEQAVASETGILVSAGFYSDLASAVSLAGKTPSNSDSDFGSDSGSSSGFGGGGCSGGGSGGGGGGGW